MQDSEFHQKFQSEDEFCAEYGISKRTAKNYRDSGLPYLDMRCIWIPRKEGAKWIEARIQRRNPPRRRRQAAATAEIGAS